ncbi:hypothetical protein ACQ4PT_010896 [Festuca glaucescens]
MAALQIGMERKAEGRCRIWVIDCDLTNYKDLVEAIIEEYPPRYLEVAHVQYYDDVLKIFPEVNSDQELMSMFEKHSQKKVVEMFIAYCDPAEPYKPITEYYSDVHIQPENNIDQDEDSYLRNPIPENEHVGIDEENTYLEKDHMPLNVVLFSDKEKEKDYIPEDQSEDESEGEKTLVSMIALVQEGKKKVQNATKHWICEKVKDWLIEDATLGARELQKKLKEHHKVKIHYKKGNPEEIAAMLAVREPPKKKIKTMKENESAIVPCMDEAPTRMSFPPSLENSSCKKGKGSNSGSGGSKRSRKGTSQPEPISIELPMPSEKTNVHVKVKSKKKKKDVVPIVPLDSPAMSTRSKKFNHPSPAMSTRSKRRLSL